MKYLIIWFLLWSSCSHAQSPLKIEDIMAGYDFIGHQPNNLVWSPDSRSVFFKWQKDESTEEDYYVVDREGKVRELSLKEIAELPVDGYQTNDRKDAFYFKKFDKVYYWTTNGTKLIYQSASPFHIHKVINDQKIIIKQHHSFFVLNHATGFFGQFIDFNKQPNVKRSENFLTRQQLELFKYIKEEKTKTNAKFRKDSLAEIERIPAFNKNNRSIGILEVDSAVSNIIFRVDDYPQNTPTQFEAHITESGYSKSINARPKVGSKNPSHELYWMDLNLKTHHKIEIKDLPGIYQKPDYLKIYSPSIDLKSDEPKAVIYTQIIMNRKGNLALIEIKSYDNKDRWITLFNIETKQLVCIDHQHSEQWIGGPGISGWNMVPGNIGWMDDDSSVYFQSEKTGYSHLYQHVLKKKKTIALTEGRFEIYSAELSRSGKQFYIIANKEHSGSRNFYHLDIQTKKWTPVLNEAGNNEISLSPDETQIAYRYSYQNKPWELYLTSNASHSEKKQITNSTSQAFKNYAWRTPEVITFKNEKGQTVYARLYRPDKAVKNGAAIQFVHGAGYLQNAHHWWSVYYREYMFHNLLCDKGYTILDIDYSASEGYGRDFRTAIYRHMGGQDLDDHLSGRKYLIDKEGIQPNKIGIYGGSYGGFITIMALLKYPGKYQCGAAIRSVTDWAHYNHPYTSNILNTPETDSIAFRQSSPIYFAEHLEDELLMLHGMVDNNVQFQDVVRLNQRFIELGKQSFSMALYPVEPHGFIKTSSWIDEYSRILNLFEKHLN